MIRAEACCWNFTYDQRLSSESASQKVIFTTNLYNNLTNENIKIIYPLRLLTKKMPTKVSRK